MSSQVWWYKCVCFRIYWKSLNLWTFILTSDPEAQSTHMNTLTERLSTPPLRPPAGIHECVHFISLPFIFTLIIPTWLSLPTFHLHRVVLGSTPRFEMFFPPMLFPVFSISSLPILSLSLFLLGYKPTHPYHKYVGRQTPFLESKTTRGITLEYGNA